MDPFEEFEFKPITEGLGFHQRAKEGKTPASKKMNFSNIDNSLEMMAPDTNENINPQIQPALPRKETGRTEVHRPTKTTSTVAEILKTLGERRQYDFEEKATAKQLYRAPIKETFVASQFEFSAALLDGMLIIASYLTAMIILLLVTKVDLFGNLVNADEESLLYMSLFGMFAAITWVYLVANRMFLGFTPGEWVFDQRLGRPEQLGTAGYSTKVALRSLIVLATGFVLIPFTSMISRRDWLGKAMGVELVKKV